jgi:hypothetical protein
MSQYERLKDPYIPSQSSVGVREFEPFQYGGHVQQQYGNPKQRQDRTTTKALGGWSATRSSAFAGDLFLALIPIFFIGKNRHITKGYAITTY